MRPVLIPVLTSTLLGLGGCASAPVAPPPAPAALDAQAEANYQLLVAEIAVVRGEYPAAAQAYWEAGRLSGDREALARAAGLAYGVRDLVLAEEVADHWAALDPSDPQPQRYRMAIGLHREDPVRAAAALSALRYGPQPVAIGELGSLLQQSPDRARTLAMLGIVAREHPEDEELLRLHMRLAASWEDWEQLASATGMLLALGVRETEVALQRSEAVERLEGAVAALAVLEAAEDGPAIERRRGELAFTAGDYQGALPHLRAALVALPDDGLLRYLLGEIALSEGRLDDAAEHFLVLRGLPGMDELGDLTLARVDRARGDLESALRRFSAITRDDLFLQAQLSAAMVEAQLREVEDAMFRLDMLERTRPGDLDLIQRERAAILTDARQYEQARALLESLLVSAPQDPNLRYALALVAAGSGSTDEAIALLEGLHLETPGVPDIMNALGYTLADAGRELPRALELIEAAHALAPDSAAILDSLGWVHFRLGDAATARGYLEQALAISEDPEIAAHLAEVLWSLGETVAATEVLDRALAVDPDHSVLLGTRERLAAQP